MITLHTLNIYSFDYLNKAGEKRIIKKSHKSTRDRQHNRKMDSIIVECACHKREKEKTQKRNVCKC